MGSSVSQADDRAGATARFFWAWLFTASSMSLAGNVTHAVMNAPRATVGLAAAAAVVPPAVLLGSTHSVALLIKTRPPGASYWCALTMTIGLAGCAFVLSFDALRDLAVNLGFHPDRAWLWPVSIDMSIAQSTLALLTLTPHPRVRETLVAAAKSAAPQPDRGGRSARKHAADTPPPRSPVTPPDKHTHLPAAGRQAAHGPEGGADAPVDTPIAAGQVAAAAFKPTARRLVREGVTSKDPDLVAAILAEHAAGTPPSTIGRRRNVHHSTVNRILSAAQSASSWSASG